jgi:hypothetical protein
MNYFNWVKKERRLLHLLVFEYNYFLTPPYLPDEKKNWKAHTVYTNLYPLYHAYPTNVVKTEPQILKADSASQ